MPTGLQAEGFRVRILLPPWEHPPPLVHVARAGGQQVAVENLVRAEDDDAPGVALADEPEALADVAGDERQPVRLRELPGLQDLLQAVQFRGRLAGD